MSPTGNALVAVGKKARSGNNSIWSNAGQIALAVFVGAFVMATLVI